MAKTFSDEEVQQIKAAFEDAINFVVREFGKDYVAGHFDAALAILNAPQPASEPVASGGVVTQCGHPSWTDIGGGKIRCAFCGVVGEERRYLLADRQQSTKEPRS